jgi:hypothetical protein
MSTDLPPAAGGRPFRRRLSGVLGTLVTLVAALGIAGSVQGPRLESAAVDPLRSVQLAGQQLRLELNQPLVSVDAESVTVTPAAAATLSFEGSTVVVTFEKPLEYSRDYSVTVPGVVGAFTSTASTIRHSFRTADDFSYALHRRSADGENDAVLRRPLDRPGDQEIVFSAPRISAFAHHGDVLAATTLDDDGHSRLAVSIPGDDAPQQITLPAEGTIRALAASPTNAMLGFQLTSVVVNGERRYENALFTLDLSGAIGGGPQLVEAADGSPIRVADWVFVPGTTSLVVQDYEQALTLIDLAGITPNTPIGRHSELRGFLPGTSTLVVADPDGSSLIDLAAGTTTSIELAASDLARERYLGKAALLDADGSYLLALSSPSADGGPATNSALALVDPAGSRTLYAPPAGSRIANYCVSPNAQFAAVETLGSAARPDGYPGVPGFTHALTLIVEIQTGRVVSGLSGGFSDWCN